MKPSFLLVFIGILSTDSTSILRRLHRCCCCISLQVNYIEDCADFSDFPSDAFDSVHSIHSGNATGTIKKSSIKTIPSDIPDHNSDYLFETISSPKTNTISSRYTHRTPFWQSDISSSTDSSDDSDNTDMFMSPPPLLKDDSIKNKLGDFVSVFCNYLNVVLKRITKDIVSIQTQLASPIFKANKSDKIKNQMIEYRRKIRSCSREALLLPQIVNPDHKFYDTMTPRNIRRVLFDEQQSVDLVSSNNTVKFEVHDIKYQIVHYLYQGLMDYINPQHSPWNLHRFLSFSWLFEHGQSFIDYLYSSVLRRNYLHPNSVQLDMDIYSNISYDEEFNVVNLPVNAMHAIIIFDNLAELARRLNFSTFHAFVHQHKDEEIGLMIETKFGIIVNDCSCALRTRIHLSNEIKKTNKIISFIDDAECEIITACAKLIIQCSLSTHSSIDDDVKRLKHVFTPKERDQELRNLLIDKFGQNSDDKNFSTYIFNTSHFGQLGSFKAILLHARNYNTLLLLSRLREQFILSNFAENNILSIAQNDQYLEQINGFLSFFKETTKEAEKVNNSMHEQINEIGSALNKIVVLSQSLISAFAIGQNKSNETFLIPVLPMIKPTLIDPQRMEKVKIFQAKEVKKKMESIIGHLSGSTFLIEAIVHHLQHDNEEILPLHTKTISYFLMMLPTVWTRLSDVYPSFKNAKFSITYYRSLMNVEIPTILNAFLRTMFSQAQKDEASSLLIELKCIGEYFEFSMKHNGEQWGLQKIKAMDQSMKKEYEGLTMHTTKKVKWHHRLFGMLIVMHHMNGHCGVKRLLNDTYSHQSLFCRWPVVRFNADFNFSQWREQNKEEMFETKEVYF